MSAYYAEHIYKNRKENNIIAFLFMGHVDVVSKETCSWKEGCKSGYFVV